MHSKHLDDLSYTRTLTTGDITFIAERAIVEYILNEKHREEGLLIEALKSYDENSKANYPLLYEVADHFNLPGETLDYWIKEAREDCEV